MPPPKSAWFGLAQTVLLVAFGAAYFLDRGAPLFAPGGLAAAAGMALCVVGLIVMLWAIVALRAVVQVSPEPRAGGHLVSGGIYAVLRHPMYTAILVIVVGLFLRKPTVLVGLAAVVVFAYLAFKVRYEERLLLERYPDYAAYMTRTWGLVPGFGRTATRLP